MVYLGTKQAGFKQSPGRLCGDPPTHQLPLPPLPFLIIFLGQPQGNPLGCTPLVANGSGHPSELGGTRRTGNGALGGPKAHRKLQTHPSLANQGSKKSKGSTKSAASQIPLQAQEGKHPVLPPCGRSLQSWLPRSLMQRPAAASLQGCRLDMQHLSPTPGPPDLNLWLGPGSLGFNKPSRESDARLLNQRTLQRTHVG